MAPWFAMIETLLVQKLLQSPGFHAAVRQVHRNVHKLRHGTPPEELGGTNIDRPGGSFVNHFIEEIKTSFGSGSYKPGNSVLPPGPSATTGRTKAHSHERPADGGKPIESELPSSSTADYLQRLRGQTHDSNGSK